MYDLNSMLYFAAIVEHGSLSAASRAVGVPTSTLSRKLDELEHRLGVRLVERSTRSLRLTEAGTAYFERCSKLANEVAEADDLVRTHAKAPKGTLRLTAPPSFGIMVMGAPIAAYLSKYPSVGVEVMLSEERLNLRESSFDLAIRVGGSVPDSSYVVRRLTRYTPALCASPGYLAAHGTPRNAQELLRHTLISLSVERPDPSWSFLGAVAKNGRVALEPRIRTNNSLFARELCRRGLGIAMLPRSFVANELRSGALTEIEMDSVKLASAELKLVMPSSSAKMAKVRAFLEVLYAHLDDSGVSPAEESTTKLVWRNLAQP
jgi:DNA-binding transcriptional LysR family regulator